MRKFTPSGAIETSFGTNGFVRTNFHLRSDGVGGDDQPQILKVQPDGKIVIAGKCVVFGPDFFNFGQDACVVRYNANGTLDSSFGGFPIQSSNGSQTASIPIDPGKAIFQTGIRANGSFGGTDGVYYDMAIQPDGKIVLVGETRDTIQEFQSFRFGAIIMRLNPNGSRDTTFGSNGIARWSAPEPLPGCPTYYQPRRFNAVRVQADGRIIAVGYKSTHDCSGASATGNRFVVTRWTSGGQLETVRHFDNRTAYEFQDERAVGVHLTRDASKILVSGSYLNQSGVPGGRQKPTMVRLNIGDLSRDTSFGNGGIAQYNIASNGSDNAILYVKAIQPDGRIIGTDNDINGRVVRFKPDGSSDQSFGNRSIDGSTTLPRGRLRVTIPHKGFVIPIDTGQILVRPNGRINLVGRVGDFTFGIGRAVVSQNTSTGAQNPIDEPQTFTSVHYYDFFSREADASGLAFWTGNITECGSNTACIDNKRTNVSQAFFLSIEFQQTGYLVFRFYKPTFVDSLARPRGMPRMEEFLNDTRTVGEGVVVGQGNWEATLAQNQQNFAHAWVQRPEFLAAFPTSMTAAQFVDKLFLQSEVTPTTAERNAAIAAFGAGGVEGRAAALRSVVDSGSVYNKQYNPAFVLMQYIGYLRRNPNDAPDNNYGGFDFWLGKMNSFSVAGEDVRNEQVARSRVQRAEMVRSFIVAGEYRGRFGQP